VRRSPGGLLIPCPSLTGAIALVATLLTIAEAVALDDHFFPDWRGQWLRVDGGHGPQFDPSKPAGRGQRAPLTAEYQAVFEANLTSLATGRQPYNPQLGCLPPGMPRAMILYEPMEVIVTSDITYLMLAFMNDLRRIYTDGREWSEHVEPSFVGYSIGKWVNADRSGRYAALEVETRHIKGPRSLGVGIPLHADNKTIVKERIYLDKGDPEIMHDEVTTIDHAFIRPWTVMMTYRRSHNLIWTEFVCAEGNNHVVIGTETYFLSPNRDLMPTRKDQPPPDLRYFNPPPK
jgi:hypothetical protein